MKVIEFLKLVKEILKVMSKSDIKVSDGEYIDLYLEYERMRKEGENLSVPNTGYTYTDYDDQFTLIFVSRATSPEQMYDSVDHEKKHAVEHISTFYGVDPKSEEAAYLAGELGRLLFPAVAMVVCPRCSN